MKELTVAEQCYDAVHAVLFDGRTTTDVAAAVGVSRQSLHTWLSRYEAGGVEALADRTSRPRISLIHMPTHVGWLTGAPVQRGQALVAAPRERRQTLQSPSAVEAA